MIEKLTTEQEAKIPEYIEKWVKIGKSTEQCSVEKTHEIINDFYKHVQNFPPPEIVIKSSPKACWEYIQEQTGMKMDFVMPYLTGSFDANIFSYYDYLIDVLKINVNENIKKLYTIWKQTTNLGIIYVFDDVCIVSKKPISIHTNTNGDLHCEDGPALEYEDDLKIWSLNGVRVIEEIVMTPWNEIDCTKILKESNAEIRRELVRKVGIERVIEQLGAECIDTKTVQIDGEDRPYELLLLDIGDNNKRPYLKMINPSIGTYHIEGVHPDCKTVDDALEWRNGTKELPTKLT